MRIGSLVRHIVHSGALGIIIDVGDTGFEIKIRWLNNNWGDKWSIRHNIEVIA